MKTKYLSILACSAAIALSLTQWKPALAGAYANPVYSMYNVTITEKEKTSGCKSVKTQGTGDLVLFDDGSWSMTGPVNATGTWAQTSPKDVWLSFNRVSDVLSVIDQHSSAGCAKPINALQPTVTTKKLKLTLNPHGQGSFSMKLKGYESDNKPFTYSYSFKAQVQ